MTYAEMCKDCTTWPDVAEVLNTLDYERHAISSDAELFLSVLNYFHNSLDSFRDKCRLHGIQLKPQQGFELVG